MDINELLFREQVALVGAADAPCPPSRQAHERQADDCRDRLLAIGFPHRRYLHRTADRAGQPA